MDCFKATPRLCTLPNTSANFRSASFNFVSTSGSDSERDVARFSRWERNFSIVSRFAKPWQGTRDPDCFCVSDCTGLADPRHSIAKLLRTASTVPCLLELSLISSKSRAPSDFKTDWAIV